MLYQQAFKIEQRLNDALRLIRRGRYSTPELAETLGVSIPTVSRCITALRERGHDIRPVRDTTGWHYILGKAGATITQQGQERANSEAAGAPA